LLLIIFLIIIFIVLLISYLARPFDRHAKSNRPDPALAK
jgi:hypothetical protein